VRVPVKAGLPERIATAASTVRQNCWGRTWAISPEAGHVVSGETFNRLAISTVWGSPLPLT
jgi:hypothetical protein